MTYRVELAYRAVRDLEILYLEKNAAESQAAARWYNGLEQALYTLATHPHRCPVAPEARKSKRKLLHLLYGKKPHIYPCCPRSVLLGVAESVLTMLLVCTAVFFYGCVVGIGLSPHNEFAAVHHAAITLR